MPEFLLVLFVRFFSLFFYHFVLLIRYLTGSKLGRRSFELMKNKCVIIMIIASRVCTCLLYVDVSRARSRAHENRSSLRRFKFFSSFISSGKTIVFSGTRNERVTRFSCRPHTHTHTHTSSHSYNFYLMLWLFAFFVTPLEFLGASLISRFRLFCSFILPHAFIIFRIQYPRVCGRSSP